MWHYLIIFLLVGVPAHGQSVLQTDYSELSRELNAVADFETLPRRPEPGFNLNALYRSRGLWLGARLDGQETQSIGAHDRLHGAAIAPLRVRPDANARNLAISYHKGFDSNGLFPLGAAGYPALSARGEGSLAVVFDQDQYGFGFRVHTDYADPLGIKNTIRGKLNLMIYGRNGGVIGSISLVVGLGVNDFGFVRDGHRSDIAGFTLTNTDPGGIAIDDIIFEIRQYLG